MLALHDLRKSFRGRTAVDGVGFEVRRGEVFGLLGPNGAGKSTTIHMAVGLLVPDAGRVTVDGRDPADAATRSLLGFCPQTLAIYEDLTARENLRFFGDLYGLDRRANDARVAELLRLIGLADRAGDRVKTFSGGMKRRLNLAAAIVHDPPVILMDEPTVGVDPQSRNALFEIVRALRDSGRAILYTTHYMEEAARLCDRVGIIDHGKVLALDSVPALIAAHGGRSVVVVQRDVGTPEERIETDEPAAVVTRELARSQVRGLAVERPSLEMVFLNLTGRTLRD